MKTALEQAVAWYARLQAPDCRPEERAQFRFWLAESAEHTRAYASVERLLRELDARSTWDPALNAMADVALLEPTPADSFIDAWRQRLLPLAAAAAVVLALFVSLTVRDVVTVDPQRAVFNTVEEPRSMLLSDGTTTSLDRDTEVTVQMRAHERAIELTQGRALFEVAHDTQRPFTVTAGSMRVTALGTRFQVQHEGAAVIVTLEEGSVEVVGEVNGESRRERLRPGEQLRLAQNPERWEKISLDTETATSWSRGRHVFRNTRLGDAVVEVNRYAQVPVRLDDPVLADLTVSGNFIVGDSTLILSAFAAALPIRVVDRGNELVLSTADTQR